MATKTRQLADFLVAGGVSDAEIQSVPHIRPGILQPAVAGKDLNGTALGGSYVYGTAHTDGHSYYYTDIKGSKPIKDPRIGAHFGSQRYKTRSLQLLEQETATEGKNIFSVDGREWFRAYSTGGGWNLQNHSDGNFIQANSDCAGCYLEITGYFNDINFSTNTHTNRCNDIDISVNGTLSVDGSTTLGGTTTVNSPLGSRYVDSGSFINGGSTLSASLGTTPAINTVRYEAKTGSSEYIAFEGIELIAQDTSSTANRSKIQIPSQNVVSYGKKFTVSGTPHYDPFNGFTNGTTLFSSKVDTATSLGLGTGTTWGAPWAISGSNHIRPFNGGRVVKWVANDGTIKTSVTMMPRNAQNVGTTASNEITTASATNSHTINFSDDAIDHSLSEVAKKFWWREFGNGAANGGTGATWADASMLNAADAIAYVMDDGLTSLSAKNALVTTGSGVPNYSDHAIISNDNDKGVYITFIGTGVSIRSAGNDGQGTYHIAQNLPYGTHILYIKRISGNDPQYIIDGVSLGTITHNSYGNFAEVTFHQPKKPPIPEDAVVLADYMLMADYVPLTATGIDKISKGVRVCSASRDIFYDASSGSASFEHNADHALGGLGVHNSGTPAANVHTAKYPAFATRVNVHGHADRRQIFVDGSSVTQTASTGTGFGEYNTQTDASTLGIHTFASHNKASTNGLVVGMAFVSPTHTSSHYQPFETPFLHELVGGDRNMEQHNLVVTSDGKTWDEVTRDTSYLGNVLVTTNWSTQNNTNTTVGVGDEFRGREDSKNLFVKDFAIAYDRLICLVDGHYQIIMGNHQNSDSGAHYSQIRINGTPIRQVYFEGTGSNFIHAQLSFPLKRGDYIDHKGMHFTDETFQFQINRLS